MPSYKTGYNVKSVSRYLKHTENIESMSGHLKLFMSVNYSGRSYLLTSFWAETSFSCGEKEVRWEHEQHAGFSHMAQRSVAKGE